MQTLFSNQINIEQNKIIKIFTMVTVAMMPPTLIATIYGMNFTHMPELEWTYAYPIVLSIMVISTILPIISFKNKKWTYHNQRAGILDSNSTTFSIFYIGFLP